MSYQTQLIPVHLTRPLRHLVLRPHQPMENCIYPDDDAPGSFHLGAFSGDQVIGIASFYQHPQGSLQAIKPYRLRGMATHPDHRSQGIASDLLKDAEKELPERDCNLLWCNARVVALGFYRKNGWMVYGDQFNVPKIGPHYVMFKKL